MNIRYGKVFKIPRKIAKHILSFIYPLVIKVFPLPKVLSIEETLKLIINNNYSIARFGDSEFLYLVDKLNLPYQKYNDELADSMKLIFKSNYNNILVGLPIGYHSLNNLKKRTKLTWRSQISWVYPRLRKYLDLNKTYANASMSRLYMDYEDTSKSAYYFNLIKKIWGKRQVLLIEGEKSRLGAGNDLFDNVKSLERILAPAHNAHKVYHELFLEAQKHDKTKLILIALGPTAKPLAYNLALQGYQAIDIGNVDIEYEWFKRGVIDKIKIPGKYTSEAIGGRTVEDINNEQYKSQIIKQFI